MTPFIDPTTIAETITKLAAAVNADYANEVSETSPLVLVVTLKGALFFAADFARKISIPTEIDFVRASSYGASTKSSGTIKVTKYLDSNIENRHVLVLDEIVDSGRTLSFLLAEFEKAKPKSLKVCSLLSKPSRREIPVNIDYLGKEVPDKFLVGYGLDFGEKYRNLPGIFILESVDGQ
jgi:hypoxanthine phosphoribosyltransferase